MPTILKIENEALPFQHKPHHHCESGAISNLFNYYNLNLSEPMVFGLGAGLYFVHASFIKVMGAPIISYRFFPGAVFKHASKLLGIEVEVQSFWSKQKAKEVLDQKVKEKVPVGLLTDMFYLEYMPEMFRFHFNAHNLVVYGKKADKYFISDSILEMPVMLNEEQLMRARFSKGVFNPRGKIYWINHIPEHLDIEGAIKKSIKTVCERMLSKKMFWAGQPGIRNLAKHIARYPSKFDEEKADALLMNVVRMQEIVGTGGSGFRTIYSDFLKESAAILNWGELEIFANRMLDISDDWRKFAIMATRSVKKRKDSQQDSFSKVSQYLYQIAEKEKQFFVDLNDLKIIQ